MCSYENEKRPANKVSSREYRTMDTMYDECIHYLNIIQNIFDEEADAVSDKSISYNVLNARDEEVDVDDLNDTNDLIHCCSIKDARISETGMKYNVKYKNSKESTRVLQNDEPKCLKTLDGETAKVTKKVENEKCTAATPVVVIKKTSSGRNILVNLDNAKDKKMEDIDYLHFEPLDVKRVTFAPKETLTRIRKLSQQLPKIFLPSSSKKLPSSFEKFSGGESKIKVETTEKRLIEKKGNENIVDIKNIPFEKLRLFNDSFHTMLQLRWRWIVLGTVAAHFAVWLVFATLWYISSYEHYDFSTNPPKKPCIYGGTDFVSIFMTSVETQATIGYGARYIDEECPESIFLFVAQLVLSTGMSGVLTCVVYAKITRPAKLPRSVGFSKNAVVAMRDGRLCLMVRVWDLAHDHIVGTEYTAHLITSHRTEERERLRHYPCRLPLTARPLPLWPLVLQHAIDSTSPLYRMTPQHFIENKYEIVVGIKGASSSLGILTQTQTSYLPHEVLWGYRFTPVVSFNAKKQKYEINTRRLDGIEQVDTPLCSAAHLDRLQKKAKGGSPKTPETPYTPGTPKTPGSMGSFSESVTGFSRERPSSFRLKTEKS